MKPGDRVRVEHVPNCPPDSECGDCYPDADPIGGLASVLRLTRPLLVLDVETTGTAPETDRIVQIARLQIEPDGKVSRRVLDINPGVPIPASATAIHGIADFDVKDAPTFRQIAADLAKRIAGCDLAGFGLRRFDLKVLAAEFKRAGVAFDPEDVTVVDAMEIFYRHQPRDLTAAVSVYCNDTHAGAHDAMADVEATVRVLAAQFASAGGRRAYGDVMPEALDVAGVAAWGENRDPNALDRDGKIVWRDSAARWSFGKHAGVTLLATPPDYLRWVMSADFGTSTKAIVRDALAGIYPQSPEQAARRAGGEK